MPQADKRNEIPNVSILIVEDDASTSELIKLLLTNSGYTVIGIASTGEEAIDLVHNIHPDLILMDINLSGDMDGITVYEQIKKSASIPVIFVSGYAQKDMLARAIQSGPSDYIVKPFKIKELLHKIKYVLDWQITLKQVLQNRSGGSS